MLTSASLVLVTLALAIDGVPDAGLSPRAIGAIGYYSVIATAGACLLYYRILAMAGSGNLLLCTLMIPPVAILLGHLVLGEILHQGAFHGFALLALGLMILDGRLLRAGVRWARKPVSGNFR